MAMAAYTPSGRIAVGHVHVARAPVLGVSGLGGEARERRDERTVAGVEAPRPLLAEGGDERDGQARIDRQQLVRAESHPLENPGAEVGDEDVAMDREPPRERATLGIGEVDPDALLVLPDLIEVAVPIRAGGISRAWATDARRVRSIRRDDSTLSTSAPSAPRIMVQCGPAQTQERSSTPYPPERTIARGAAAGVSAGDSPSRPVLRRAVRGRRGGAGDRLPTGRLAGRQWSRIRAGGFRSGSGQRDRSRVRTRIRTRAGERTIRGGAGLPEGGGGPGEPPPAAAQPIGRPQHLDPSPAPDGPAARRTLAPAGAPGQRGAGNRTPVRRRPAPPGARGTPPPRFESLVQAETRFRISAACSPRPSRVPNASLEPHSVSSISTSIRSH